MEYNYLTKSQINELKIDLMHKRSRSFTGNSKKIHKVESLNTSRSFSQMYIQNRNCERGPIFEENVRKTLNVEFNWKNDIINRHFYYRIISIGHRTLIIKKGEGIKIKLNGRRLKFFLYSNGVFSIYSGDIRRRFIGTIKEKKKTMSAFLRDVKISVSGLKECEIDGFFQIKNNAFKDLIESEDLEIIYNNINEQESDLAKYACCEIKLNKRRIPLMINQLRRDKKILEEFFGYENIIYIGFVGFGIIDNSIIEILNSNSRKISLAILGIKNCEWLGRNLLYYNDWTTIERLINIDEKLNILINARNN